MTESQTPNPAQPATSKRERAIFFALILGLVVVQWPMLKGMYYKHFTPEISAQQSVAWRTDFAAAQQEAARSGKPLLVDFSASWCPPCQVMKHDVWTDGTVRQKANDNYIPVLLDIDLPANRPLAEKYGIRGIPAVLVLDASGQVKNQAAYMDAATTIEFLSQ